MLSTAEDIISSRTIAAGDGREVAAVAAAAAAAATNIPLHSHFSHSATCHWSAYSTTS